MRPWIEICTFSGVAAGLHLAAWSVMSDPGASSVGGGGDAPVTLAAASQEVSALVGEWMTPPDLSLAVDQPVVDPAMDDSPAPVPAAVAPQSVPVPDQPKMPTADDSPAPPQVPSAPPLEVEVPEITMRDTPLSEESDIVLTPPLTSGPLLSVASPVQPRAPSPLQQPMPRIDRETPVAGPAPRVSLRPLMRPETLTPVAQPQMQARAKPDTDIKQTPKPAAPSSDASTARQSSAGSTKGNNAGQTRETSAATLSTSQQQSLVSHWGGAIRTQVERRKKYPSGATATGTTVVRLSVAPQGQLLSATIATSSGDARLDQAAVDAVRRARIPGAPKGLSAASYRFDLPIAFRK